ncbi:DUF2066 domain-containing protein [Paraglaciecola aquimarina]|uniref:DUF2066 domain-containing protein n=1 Tax=Paraglaciecola algarum TaxID=3050085 RepID=A0ABS9D7K3_9ALTE|nr:DUF2066 domain-containing protein [Paraglaciecola sp. G1-23]MCF2948931.1 DUF2066 domain-containing protein [Paraglaciecola sp. G1-23]
MPIKQYIVKLAFCWVILFAWHTNLHAAVIEGLFDANVAVINQSDNNRAKAFQQGMKQVLIKVHGSDDLLKDQEIRKAITRVTRYVRAYSYETVDTQQFITINFDQDRISELIRTAGFTIWGKRRPDTLVWLGMQLPDSNNKTYLTIDNQPQIYAAMSKQAAYRGINLVYPLWDLNDVQNLSVYDIWGGFTQRIIEASYRYGVQSIISARVYQSQQASVSDETELEPVDYKPGQWVVDWTSIEDGKILSGQLTIDSFEDLAVRLINELADQLSAKYAIDIDSLHSNQEKTKIVINNIASIESYVQVLAFLESLSVVNNATLINQNGSRATFELSLFGEFSDLNTALKLESKLQPVMDEFGQSLNNAEFLWFK